MFRRLILNLHMYGGLLCCGYLILLGFSSLQFVHHFLPDPPAAAVWERDLVVPGEGEPKTRGEAVRDSLGLFGSVRNASVTKQGNLRFVLSRPGRNYVIASQANGTRVKVEETRYTWNTANALHGLNDSNGSKVLAVWSGYTELATIFGVLAAMSGIYLFATVKRDRLYTLITLATTTVLSIGTMVYFLVHG